MWILAGVVGIILVVNHKYLAVAALVILVGMIYFFAFAPRATEKRSPQNHKP